MCLFFFFLSQVLTVYSLLSVPPPLRLASPLPHVALALPHVALAFATCHPCLILSPSPCRLTICRPCRVTPSPRVALSCRPLATCCPHHVASIVSPPCHVALSPLTTRPPSPHVTLVALHADLWGKWREISEWVGMRAWAVV